MKKVADEVTADLDTHASSGNCIMRVPEAFDRCDEDGNVVLLSVSPFAAQAESVRCGYRDAEMGGH